MAIKTPAEKAAVAKTGTLLSPVVIAPNFNEGNAFLDQIQKGLAQSGFDVFRIRKLIGLDKKLVGSVAILNWVDEASSPIHFIKQMVKFVLLKLYRCSLILVIHNRRPHAATTGLGIRTSLWLRRMLCKRAAAIIVLCDETNRVLQEQLGEQLYEEVESRIVKIPHPTYAGAYSEAPLDFRAQYGIPEKSFLFSFVGAICPYKNIELIIEIARRFQEEGIEAFFLVAGSCKDAKYLATLQHMARGLENMVFAPEFVPDEHMMAFVRSADALILPYNTESSLNSGTCMLAFTYGRTVVCPRIGTIQEFPLELTFNYECESSEEELEALYDAAMRTYRSWADDRKAFDIKGERLATIVAEQNSVERTGARYAAVINQVKTQVEQTK